MSWHDKYMGIPFFDHGRNFDGCDCYGLVRLIFLKELAVELPMLVDNYDTTEDRQLLENIINERKMILGFEEIEIDEVDEFDVVIIRQCGANCHLGIIVGKNLVLHTEEKIGASVRDITSPHLKPRIREAWRYVG